jgi:hypothetical protein
MCSSGKICDKFELHHLHCNLGIKGNAVLSIGNLGLYVPDEGFTMNDPFFLQSKNSIQRWMTSFAWMASPTARSISSHVPFCLLLALHDEMCLLSHSQCHLVRLCSLSPITGHPEKSVSRGAALLESFFPSCNRFPKLVRRRPCAAQTLVHV